MRVPRFFAAIAGASALTIALTGAVAADSSGGTVGHFVFTDSSSMPGAACGYMATAPGTFRIGAISVRPPKVWWPDTTPTSSTEHGLVGWRVIIRYRHMGATTWTLLKRSAFQYGIAFEDHPAFNPLDAARFTRINVFVNGSNFLATDQFMATSRVVWFNPNLTVKGWAMHNEIFYNRFVGRTSIGVTGQGYCVDQVRIA